MGNKAQRAKAQRGKTQPRSPGTAGDRALTAAARRLQRLRSRSAGRGTHTPRAPPAHAALRSALRAARRAGAARGGPARQEVARLSEPGRPSEERCGASSSGRERVATPAVRAGAADSAGPGQAATHPWRAHPSVRPSRSRRCGPSVRQPRGSRATSRSGVVAGERGDQQAAPGRRARRPGARPQWSRLGSVVRPARCGRTAAGPPWLVPAARVPPLHPYP